MTQEIAQLIDRALASQLEPHRAESHRPRSAWDFFAELVGESDAMTHAVEIATRIAPTDKTVLLVGEPGAGKERLARAIHELSRRERPVVPVILNHGSTEQLAHDLLGYGNGGSGTTSHGMIERADGSTLYLDDIADMPPSLQPALLRLLQDGVVIHNGEVPHRRLDVRLIAATRRDLSAAVAGGRFREELYYRIRVVEIRLPALRERRQDIRHLASAFARKHAGLLNREAPALTAEAIARLEQHDWPGNLRELENVIERAVVLAAGDTLDVDLLAIDPPRTTASTVPGDLRLAPAVDRVERETIVQALDASGGVKAQAARRLGVSERTLWYKLRKHGLS
jgi:DNA-binding NtrC family response regulator